MNFFALQMFMILFSGPTSETIDTALLSDFFQVKQVILLDDTDDDALVGQIDKAILVNDEIWVLDTNLSKAVFRFDLNGQFVGRVGREGKGPGEFLFPDDINYDGAGHVYLRTRFKNKLLVFDTSGQFIRDLDTKPLYGIAFNMFSKFVFHGQKIYGTTSRQGSLSQLVMYDMKGSGYSPRYPAPKDLHHDRLEFESNITKFGPYIAYNAHTFTGAFLFNPDTGEHHKLEVGGFPHLIDVKDFDFKKKTFQGESINQLPTLANMAVDMINIDDQYLAVGGLSFERGIDLLNYAKTGRWPAKYDGATYYQVFNQNGDRVVKKLKMRASLDDTLVRHTYSTKEYAIFIQTWEGTQPLEGNPMIHIMVPKKKP